MRAAIMVCAFGFVARTAFARDVPVLAHRVTDVAGLLQPAQKARIEAHLKSYQMRTGREFALLIVPDLDDEPIDAYSMRVAEAWKLGRKPQDDGLLLLIALHERRVRIEVGYGLEGDITDALSSQIIRNIVRPSFRDKTYAEGIIRAFDVLMTAADKSPVEGLLPKDEGASLDEQAQMKIGFWVLLGIVILLFVGPRAGFDILFLLLSMLGNGGRGGRSGGRNDDTFSGGGGGFGGGGASGDW